MKHLWTVEIDERGRLSGIVGHQTEQIRSAYIMGFYAGLSAFSNEKESDIFKYLETNLIDKLSKRDLIKVAEFMEKHDHD